MESEKMMKIGEGERRLLMAVMAGMPSEIKKKIKRSDERLERLKELKAPEILMKWEEKYNAKLRRQLKKAEKELAGSAE